MPELRVNPRTAIKSTVFSPLGPRPISPVSAKKVCQLLVGMRERYQRVVADAPDGADVDLSLVRIPDDWLIFPAPGGEMNAPRNPDAVTRQFTKRAEKILAFQSAFTIFGCRTGPGCLIRAIPFTRSLSGLGMTLLSCSRSTPREPRRATSLQLTRSVR
jgi:hypothetical protein